MSEHMQLTVSVTPHYHNDFKGTYPKLGRSLGHLDEHLVNRNPSLYNLAGQVDQLLYHFDGTPLRGILLPYKDRLRNTYNEIQESIADWNLARADQLLYRLEDIFNEIESRLD